MFKLFHSSPCQTSFLQQSYHLYTKHKIYGIDTFAVITSY